MKWVVRIGAGISIALIVLSVSVWHHYIYRWPVLVLFVLAGAGAYEGIDTSSWFDRNDDDDDPPVGPLSPA